MEFGSITRIIGEIKKKSSVFGIRHRVLERSHPDLTEKLIVDKIFFFSADREFRTITRFTGRIETFIIVIYSAHIARLKRKKKLTYFFLLAGTLGP